MLEKLTRHYRHIHGGGQMSIRFIVETGAVVKVGIRHAELLCSLVYHSRKRLVAAGEIFSESCAGIVCAVNSRGLQEIVNRHLLALFEPYLRAALGRGYRRCGDHVVERYLSAVYGLGDKQESHYFGHGGGEKLFVGIHRHEHLAR